MKISSCIIFILIITTFLLIVSVTAVNSHVDQRTEEVCRELGGKLQEESKGTEYEELDFYQMCVDNIRYTSPLKR